MIGCAGILYSDWAKATLMGEPFSCDTSLLRKCVTRNLGYEVLGTVHRRLLEDDLEGLEADLSNGECAKGGAMLVFACLHGARRCAQYLVKQGALEGLEIMKRCGGPLGFFIPITMAAALCHWEVVESLMEGGAEAHAFDSGERSALLIAVDNYPNANLEFLLRHEATRQHINTANGYGMTPLMAASASAVPLLVEAGGDVNLDTPEGGTALGHACQFGQLDKIKALGKYGADVQHADCHGITPLMQATQRGQADIVEYLLGRPGINIDAKAADGNTALYLACDNANFEVLQLLVAAGARVEPKASDEWGPLALAAFRGKIEVVKYLAEECGADEQRAGPDGRTPLILAAEENRADIVEYLLGRPGMDIQAKTAVGVTALDIACQNGHLETVKLLVGAGANLKPQANEVVGPVQIAIARGHLEVVKYLVECGADDRRVYPGRCTGLERAAREGHADVVEYLLGRPGVDIDAKTPAGATMLSTACRKGHVEVVKLLMAAGARVDAHSDTELPATTSAVVGGHLGLLKYLVEDAGVDVLRVDRPVNQPLIWAINLGHTDIVQYLLGLPGMDINAKIALGERVLDFACGSASGSSHLEVVKLLVAAGARVNPQASDEFGPLALAASRGRTEVVKYLMEECGADERRAGPYGYTPLMLAAQGGHADIEEYLRRTISCREQEVRVYYVSICMMSADVIMRCIRPFKRQRRGLLSPLLHC
jgi:ankyrin repeat protein